jgi:hypothetical protein
MPENRAPSPETKRADFSENRGLDQVVTMAAVVTHEPIASAPSGSAGEGTQATGGTAPADFDG